jgi:hypothetical protein
MKAAGATNVSVDLEDLDCTVCFLPSPLSEKSSID